MGDRQWFILYVLVCLEVGIFLLLVPWSAIWERNYFLQAFPSLRPLVLAPAFRGAVAGLGLANIYWGLSELLSRRRGRAAAAAPRVEDDRADRSDRIGSGDRDRPEMLAASEDSR